MTIRKITFLLTGALLFACWVMSGQNVFGFLLLALALMAAASLLLFLYASSSVTAQIQVPEHGAKHAAIPVEIRLGGGVLLSAMQLKVTGHMTNLLTGEVLVPDSLSPGPDQRADLIRFSYRSPRCGKLNIELEHVLITDPLGLFCRKKQLHSIASTLIMPETFGVSVELATPDLPDIESTDYSPIRPGDDPSELFGIRDYREGDPLRSIHWKLSEKYDRTVMREMSLPVAHSILLLLDNCPANAPEPDAASAIVEAMLSLSQSLCDESIPHQIAWLDHETGLITFYTISGPDDLFGLQGLLLSSRIMQDDSGIVTRLLDQEIPEYSHMLLFAVREPEGFDAINHTTLLLPQAEPESGVSCLREHFEAIIL